MRWLGSTESNTRSSWKRPGIRSKILAGFFPIVPRMGSFKALAFEKLTPETEQLYMVGFNASIDRYRELLAAVGTGRLRLPNDNIDVGIFTRAGKYRLTDIAYAKLLHKLDGHYVALPQDLRSDILAFYQDLSLPIETKSHESDWIRLQKELSQLASINPDLTADSPAAKVATASTGAGIAPLAPER